MTVANGQCFVANLGLGQISSSFVSFHYPIFGSFKCGCILKLGQITNILITVQSMKGLWLVCYCRDCVELSFTVVVQ